MINNAPRGAIMVTSFQKESTNSSRRFLRLGDVKSQVGLGRSAIYQKIKAGDFPAPVSLGARAVAWLSDEIAAWMDARIEVSRKTTGGA
jgi:prophage regulatory protein